MKDFTKIWKKLHADKAITCRDVIQHCILRAMRSKSDTEQVLKHLIHKAFTPLKYASDPYRVIGQTYAGVDNYRTMLFNTPYQEILDTDDEINEFNEWANRLYRKSTLLLRHYSYFFTRQDIKPEFQLVQTAHAALVLGNWLKPEQVKDLHFTCIGVADAEEMKQAQDVLDALGHHYEVFREPDLGNIITCIAVEPIAENKRGILRNYPLLTFENKQEIKLEETIDRYCNHSLDALRYSIPCSN